MPQFNSVDDMLPNHGLPPELIYYQPKFLSAEESAELSEKLIRETHWEQKTILTDGTAVFTPRLIAKFGNLRNDLPEADKVLGLLPWTSEQLLIKERVENFAQMKFDFLHANYYRNGDDSVGWHTDTDESGKVLIINLGQTRMFDVRNNEDHSLQFSLKLKDGDCLILKMEFQSAWQYRIPKLKAVSQSTIQLIFKRFVWPGNY